MLACGVTSMCLYVSIWVGHKILMNLEPYVGGQNSVISIPSMQNINCRGADCKSRCAQTCMDASNFSNVLINHLQKGHSHLATFTH